MNLLQNFNRDSNNLVSVSGELLLELVSWFLQNISNEKINFTAIRF